MADDDKDPMTLFEVLSILVFLAVLFLGLLSFGGWLVPMIVAATQ